MVTCYLGFGLPSHDFKTHIVSCENILNITYIVLYGFASFGLAGQSRFSILYKQSGAYSGCQPGEAVIFLLHSLKVKLITCEAQKNNPWRFIFQGGRQDSFPAGGRIQGGAGPPGKISGGKRPTAPMCKPLAVSNVLGFAKYFSYI